MKKIIFILLVATFSKNVSAQIDTLVYLQNIVANKSQYIGQPFSVLKSSLQIQIKFFSPFASLPYDKTRETSTSFSFYFPQAVNDIYLTYPSLDIYWQTSLNANQSDALWESTNGGGWSSAVDNFYANAIIADIKVRN